ncbi:MAG: hypothetical protein JST54_24950 [Deltaproteobacteria bacterium]|nr:hypothetical protein [Deltaproteobacteria bacterium]
MHRLRSALRALPALVVLGLLPVGCRSSKAPAAPPVDGGVTPVDAGSQSVKIVAGDVDTRFTTREHFLAGAEMQLSGEPFAEAMGRVLTNYSRDHLPADLYFDTSPLSGGPWIDLPGFSSGVESYEYSKQPMNMVALESGAGTSLLFAPLVSPDGGGGPDSVTRLGALMWKFSQESNAAGAFVFEPDAGTPLGWPGIWPTLHAFKSFDPTIDPTGDVALSCSITSDDDPGAGGQLLCADYECDASTLHLRDRASQIDPTITPGADGFSAWKYGLWTINYLQVMHDATEAAASSVASTDLGNVGALGNSIVAEDDTGAPLAAGTFLGSSRIEGFQAAMFILEVDNRAEEWLTRLTTADGSTLSGFASLSDALAYDETAPLRWFPSAIRVTESSDSSGFPRPSYALASADSDLLDLSGMAAGYGTFYALTDTTNLDVGGSQPALVYFDGDPFPADDQLADGEPTLHDRALAMIRVALVDLDRIHRDPQSGVLVDSVQLGSGAPVRGTTASTIDAAYALIGMRTALRALSSQLKLYSNNTPDTAVATTPLDTLPLHAADASQTFTQRLGVLIRAEGDLLLNHLTDEAGRAWSGWDVAQNAHVDDQDLLDSHTAAVRGLFAAYLATGDTRYRTRALAVYARLEQTFYDANARLYGQTPAPVTSVTFTPLRFALLQSTLRDMYELEASRPGNGALALELESRVGRLNKLVLNGWDDANDNRIVDWPDECVNVVQGLPRGGLEMAERTLTGEIGSLADVAVPGVPRVPTSDREHDCVPEIDDAHLPAALADSITLNVVKVQP